MIPFSLPRLALLIRMVLATLSPTAGEEIKLNEATSVFLHENHNLPIVQIFLASNRAEQYDPPGKEGLAAVTWKLLVRGGSTDLPGLRFTEGLDSLGASVSAGIDEDSILVSFWSLERNFPGAWKMFFNALYNPSFGRETLELLKGAEKAAISQRANNPNSMCTSSFKRLVYGKKNRKGRFASTESIKSISLEDIETFYRTHIRGTVLKLAVYGDFNSKDMLQVMKKSFKQWKGTISGMPGMKPSNPELRMSCKPGIYFLNKKNLPQASICIGHLGISRRDKNLAAVDIFNFIYGAGGLNSRLARELRIKRGLVYYPYGAVTKRNDKGLFISTAATKNESVGETIEAMIKVINSMINKPVSELELKMARKSSKSAMSFHFESPARLLSRKLLFTIKGYPSNYFDTYMGRVEKVDAPKVLAVSRRMVRPLNLVIMIVGDGEKILPLLASLELGKVTEIHSLTCGGETVKRKPGKARYQPVSYSQ